MKFFYFALLLVSVTGINALSFGFIDHELERITEQLLDRIYQISAQELQTSLGKDFGLVPLINATDLQIKMNDNKNLLIVNVLPTKWYDDCHIPGSVSVPLKDLIYEVRDWDRSQEIVVYCALDICDAGEKAYMLLVCMGFTHVIDYHGGIKEWFQLGLPVNGPCAASYLHEEQSRAVYCAETEFDVVE